MEAASAPPEAYAAAMDDLWPLLPVPSSIAALSPSKAQGFGNDCLKSENPLPKILVGLSKEARASEDAGGGPLQMWSAGTSIGECWSPGFPPLSATNSVPQKEGQAAFPRAPPACLDQVPQREKYPVSRISVVQALDRVLGVESVLY